jgi:hypothetical protein
LALDLPSIEAAQPPVLARLAVFADPWPGAVTVWSSIDGLSYGLAAQASEKIAADLAARELAVEQRERELASQSVLAEQGRWYTALPRPLFAFAFVIYVWKVVVWDKVLALGSTDPLSGDVAHWATIVLTAYFGGRSIEKVARILTRK